MLLPTSFAVSFLGLLGVNERLAHAVVLPGTDPSSTREIFFRRVYSRAAKGASAVSVGAILAGRSATAAASVPPSGAESNALFFEQSPCFSSIEPELESKNVGWSVQNAYASDAEPAVSWSDLRYGTSTLSDRSRAPVALDSPTEFPPWMVGTWSARMKFVGATFPQGRKILTLRVPGAGLGTCLSLPNVGFNPALFPWRFQLVTNGTSGSGAVFEDLAYSAPRRFEAFWPESKVESVQVGTLPPATVLTPRCFVTGEGCSNPHLHDPSTRVAIEFTGPTRRGGRVTQTVDVSTIRSSSCSATADGITKFAVTRQYVQNNVEQDLQTFYREVMSLKPGGAHTATGDTEVNGKLRVAAFLPNDPKDAQNTYNDRYAVAIYDYKIFLSSLTEDEAASM